VKGFKIPEATISRLSVYSRYLESLYRKGITTVSSADIAQGVGVTSAQVRKDLAYFGEFGTRGVGYNVKELLDHTLKILGLNNTWNMVVVGAGNLGSALCAYRGFRERGFYIVGVFDNDLTKIGKKINEYEVLPIDHLEEVVRENNVEIGIIAVPAAYAQDVATRLVKAGVKGILNFAPTVLNIPDKIIVRSVDLTVNLEVLTFNIRRD